MYVRSRNTAVTGASASASTGETSSAKYTATLIARYATTEVITSTALRSRRGLA
jgi:hypothetical protein